MATARQGVATIERNYEATRRANIKKKQKWKKKTDKCDKD